MFYKIIIATTFLSVSFGVEFQIENHGKIDIWVGIRGNVGQPHLNGGGFDLPSGKKGSVQAPENWAGRFWGRTGCNSGNNHCETGDCGNKLQCNGAGGAKPLTLAEIILKGYQNFDFYDISLVDGFNIMISIQPIGGQGDGSQYNCQKSACQVALNGICPEKLKVKNANGTVIACSSACNAFKMDQYCCRDAFGAPDTCKSFSQFFKSHCPDANSDAYDDDKSIFTCKAETYLITMSG